ncbi:MAG: coenzyme F390 synthetase [Vulcanimicrobiaceae bacterium]
MNAARVARDLDERFLAMVRAYAATGVGPDEAQFDALARETFAYQYATNAPYRAYAQSRGVGDPHAPRTWREVPAVPASAFKDATLATFDIARRELEFHTSGTTADRSGKHYVERAALYDASLLAGFDRFMLADRAKLRYLQLVPNPRNRPHSSLGYMMGHVAVLRGDGKAAYFLDDDAVDVVAFTKALDAAIAARRPVCIAGTAFALVALLDGLSATGRTFVAPPLSRIMETGGFKGRTRVVERAALYASLEATFAIAQADIVAEYGMTELVSQYYDAPATRSQPTRAKTSVPWLRTLVLDGDGREVERGETGFLRHVDLGNRSSVVAIDTEDRGYATDDGIVLLGRETDAPLRGCSLDAEDLARGGQRDGRTTAPMSR